MSGNLGQVSSRTQETESKMSDKELFEYVKISQNNEGFTTIEVCFKDRTMAVKEYIDTLEELGNCEGVYLADATELETKASNENTKFIPTVTVKGRGEQVTTRYVEELTRMRKIE